MSLPNIEDLVANITAEELLEMKDGETIEEDGVYVDYSEEKGEYRFYAKFGMEAINTFEADDDIPSQ